MKSIRFWVFCLLGFVLAALPVVAYPSGQLMRSLAADATLHSRDNSIEVAEALSMQVKQAETPAVPETVAPLDPAVPGGEAALQPFEDVVKDTETLAGLFTLHRHRETGKVYLEIKPDQLNQNFLSVTTLDSGIGEGGLYRGFPVSDFLFQFRRVNNNIQLVVPNLHFQTQPGDPQRRSVDRSFSDSVLYALPIVSIHSERQTLLIDLADLLNNRDLPGLMSQFSWILGTDYSQNSSTSYISDIKTFPMNVEVESIYGFSGGSNSPFPLDTLPDQRAFSLSVRYSFSQLPTNNGYRSRVADDRIGYFISAHQDLTDAARRDPFVRYINRWQLEKQDPSLSLSSAKEPIVFWIENTVPVQYRDAIREGILMWNQAFEAIGIQNAIEARQMPDDADWDPADVRYNTVRWSNSFQGGVLGLGPARVNPMTGQILDADIVLDANIVRFAQEHTGFLSQEQQAVGASSVNGICSNSLRLLSFQGLATPNSRLAQALQERFGQGLTAIPSLQHQEACFGLEATRQMALGALSVSMTQNLLPSGSEMQGYVHQFLRYLTAHEVGHTLGLRHNFRGSTMLMPEELHNTDTTQAQGLVGSVMDYVPVNLAPQGAAQGDYFPTVLGPYDRWAIEYGYTPVANDTPQAERQQLQRIAQRSAEPGLSYSTDEDASDFFDPSANVWDMSSDTVRYSQWQLDNARSIWTRLDRRYPLPGEGYSELRDRFDLVFSYYFDNALNLTRYVGGQTFNRDRRGEPSGRPPFELVPIDQQRQALSLLQQYVFAPDAFNFSPELVNQLAPSRWSHWGSFPTVFRLDYPVYDSVLFLQTLVLSDLLSSQRMVRLRDAELRAAPGETLTLPDLFDTLQTGIWTEVEQADRPTTISSQRRGLQRQYMNMLITMTLRNSDTLETATNFLDFIVAIQTYDAPEDARVLARYKLRQLQDAIATTLRRGRNLDTATRAHLEDSRDRITKALDAELQSE